MTFWKTKRFWKRVAIGLAIFVASALIVNAVFTYRVEQQLRAKVAALRAAGQPASISDLAPTPIPDNENAAVILRQVEPRLIEFSKEYAAFYDTPLGKAYDDEQDGGDVATHEQIEAIRAILTKYRDVRSALDKAAACDKYASLLDYSLNNVDFVAAMVDQWNGQGGIRTGARFLDWEAEVALADGKYEQALETGIEMNRLARQIENEPSAVSYLIAIAVRGIAHNHLYDALAAGPVSPALHAALEDELARQEDPERLRRMFLTERALCADSFEAYPDQPSATLPYSAVASKLGWLQCSYQLGAVEFLDDILAQTNKPWYELQEKFGATDPALARTGHGVLADLWVPALQAVLQANARGIMLARAVRIDNALREFAEKNGHEARGFEDLTLPKEATIDPFNGKPLKLKQTKEGWVIYSVMTNGVDDGGDFEELKDYGVAPRRARVIYHKEESSDDKGQTANQ